MQFSKSRSPVTVSLRQRVNDIRLICILLFSLLVILNTSAEHYTCYMYVNTVVTISGFQSALGFFTPSLNLGEELNSLELITSVKWKYRKEPQLLYKIIIPWNDFYCIWEQQCHHRLSVTYTFLRNGTHINIKFDRKKATNAFSEWYRFMLSLKGLIHEPILRNCLTKKSDKTRDDFTIWCLRMNIISTLISAQ